MSFRGDERAVSVVVGAVLLLGILVSVLALYQLNVVPEQNADVEFQHNERLEGDLIALQSAIDDANRQHSGSSVPVTLGTQYEPRTVAINPPSPSGRLRTITPEEDVEIEIDDGDGWDGISRETNFLVYEPGYNEYSTPPTTVYEHSLLYDDVDDTKLSVAGPSLFPGDGSTMVIPIVEGELVESDTGTVSVPVRNLETVEVTEIADARVTLPTDAPSLWASELDDHDVTKREDSVVVEPDVDRVEIVRVAVGDHDGSNDPLGIGQPIGDGTAPPTSGGSAWDVDWNESATEASNTDPDVSCSGGRCTVTTTQPGGDFSLVAETTAGGSPVEGASVDFARDGTSAVDEMDPESATSDADGHAETSVNYSLGGEDSTSFEVHAASGGDGDALDVTIQRAVSFDSGPATSIDAENSIIEFELTALLNRC